MLEGTLKFTMIGFSYIFENPLCFVAGQDDLESFKDLLDTFCGCEMVGHVLQFIVDDSIESNISGLQSLLDLLVNIIKLLSASKIDSGQPSSSFFFFKG